MMLAVFERPQWTYYEEHWRERDRFPSTNISYVPELAAAVLGMLCVAVMSVCIYVEVRLFRLKSTGSIRASSLLLLLLLLFCWVVKLIDYFCLCVSVGLNQNRLFNTTPVEILFLLLVEKNYLLWLTITVKSLPRITALVSLLGLVLIAFTVLALMIFDPNSDEANKCAVYCFDVYFDVAGIFQTSQTAFGL